MIHGGTARNILARECEFDWEFRGLPGVATAHRGGGWCRPSSTKSRCRA